jgi:hypothetical protein
MSGNRSHDCLTTIRYFGCLAILQILVSLGFDSAFFAHLARIRNPKTCHASEPPSLSEDNS